MQVVKIKPYTMCRFGATCHFGEGKCRNGTHDLKTFMENTGICCANYLDKECDGSCNCSHDSTLNQCIASYQKRGWQNFENIHKNALRFIKKLGATEDQIKAADQDIKNKLCAILGEVILTKIPVVPIGERKRARS